MDMSWMVPPTMRPVLGSPKMIPASQHTSACMKGIAWVEYISTARKPARRAMRTNWSALTSTFITFPYNEMNSEMGTALSVVM